MNKKIVLGLAATVLSLTAVACGNKGTAAPTNEEATTSTELQTVEVTTEAATKEAETTTAEVTEPAISKHFEIEVAKVPAAFKKVGAYSYASADASYTYDVLDDATNHVVEASLDEESTKIQNPDVGILNRSIYWLSGKKDGKYYIKAYKSIGATGDVTAYVGIEYYSSKEVIINDISYLLTDNLNIIEK